jgi:hypothetical protein
MKIPWNKQLLVQTDFPPELIEIVALDAKRLGQGPSEWDPSPDRLLLAPKKDRSKTT